MVNVRIFIFYNITMAMAEACLGGIGIYPPHPERLPMPSRRPEAKPTDKGGIGNLKG